MEREFLLRRDTRGGYFVRVNEEMVLGHVVQRYVFTSSRKNATVFHGDPENDAALIEKASLALGLVQRDLRVAEYTKPPRQGLGRRIYAIRVPRGVTHDHWIAGKYVKSCPGKGYEVCELEEARLFTVQRDAKAVLEILKDSYGVKFQVVVFAEVLSGS